MRRGIVYELQHVTDLLTGNTVLPISGVPKTALTDDLLEGPIDLACSCTHR